MNKENKQVLDEKWIEDIMKRGRVIHVALCTLDGNPYIVPMGYGYESGVIYLHGSPKGLKNELVSANPRVSFNVALDLELVRDEKGAEFTYKYRSVTGFGDVDAVEGLDGKNKALAILMRQYGGPHTDLTNKNAGSVWIAKILIREMKGKSSGYPMP
jgi:nitroimidazol reductase NimA-like FMN-containing flavoprotein (pyridoxamine 5'-phosphate oxidase superfamily)